MRRTKSLIFTFTASVLLAVALLLGLDLWWRHDRAIKTAQTRADNLSVAFSEYIRGALSLADTSLRQLAIHGRRVGGPTAPSSEWLPILEAAQVALPGSGSASVIDAKGIIRHSTVREIVGQRRHESYLFQYLAAHDVEEMVADAPFLSTIYKGRYLLPVGRRLETADGHFAGIAVSVVLPDAFREFFKTIDIGREGIIWVFHPNRDLIFREPPQADPPGERAADGRPVLAAAMRAPGEGLVMGPVAEGGQTYISAYRRLKSPPLLIAVSLSEHEALADWRAQFRIAGLGFTLFAVTLFGLMFLLFHQIDARSRSEHALAEVQQVEAARLREANDRLEDALRREQQAREATDEASRLKDEFLMTLSHELRTPLNAIVGWVRMLSGGALGEDQRARALATIDRNAQAQTRLVEELLDVSRAITGKLQLTPRPVNPGEAVLAAVETLRPAMAAKDISFRAEADTTLPAILADPDRLQQVVWNLLSNAIKFTPAGGTVQLRVARVQDGVEILVRDTGGGIPPSFLPFIFDRFRQADSSTSRETGGLGLGLAIARHLVELHGGTISAESGGVGQGATFRVVLPVRPPATLATSSSGPVSA